MSSSSCPPSGPTGPTNPTNSTDTPLNLKERISQRHPSLTQKLSQLRLTIAPIVHIETGHPPPQFPPTMLSLFLLTESQLDSMAHFYSQSTPSPTTLCYPQTMDWNQPMLEKPRPGEPEGCSLSDLERLRVKMRMFARFVGMRGAETPGWERERWVECVRGRIDWGLECEERAAAGRGWGGGGGKWYRGPGTYP